MEKLEWALYKCYMDAKMLAYRFLYDEDGDVNIVSIVVLIGIAIMLAFAFRDQIGKTLGKMFNAINGKAGKVTDEAPITVGG